MCAITQNPTALLIESSAGCAGVCCLALRGPGERRDAGCSPTPALTAAYGCIRQTRETDFRQRYVPTVAGPYYTHKVTLEYARFDVKIDLAIWEFGGLGTLLLPARILWKKDRWNSGGLFCYGTSAMLKRSLPVQRSFARHLVLPASLSFAEAIVKCMQTLTNCPIFLNCTAEPEPELEPDEPRHW